MLHRSEVEQCIRRWHTLEVSRGNDPVIDYDCAPSGDRVTVDAYPDRLVALDEFQRLRSKLSGEGALSEALEAHTAYLSALIGEQIPFGDYIKRTQGCTSRGWSSDYVTYRGQLARQSLATVGVRWSADTMEQLRGLEGTVAPEEAGAAIRDCADKFEPTIRQLTGSTAGFQLIVENVEVEAYWSYWLDGTGHQARLRINVSNASFSHGEIYLFALHEVLGHALQYSSLAAAAESQEVCWPRLLAIHCSHQVLFEGLAQVLPLIASPDDVLVQARTRLNHYIRLVEAELHLLVSQGESIAYCREHALRRLPFWTNRTIESVIADRSGNPQLRSYLWAYPAGFDWFINLTETVGAGGGTAVLAEVLREAYQRPLSPCELQQLWPAGPTIGGNA